MTTDPSGPVELLSELEHAHRHALAALDDPGTSSLAAITWASAHLAAVEHVLYPAAAAALPDGPARVRSLRARDHSLQLALWHLDRRLTGDVHLSGVAVADLEEQVRAGLAVHTEAEAQLVGRLKAALDVEQQRELDNRLSAAMLKAPTRPHPDTRHGRLTGRTAFWFGGVVDRLRDGLDSRSVPTPHTLPVRRPMGRWGAYAMGVPFGREHGQR
jgi:hypothetical protein